MRVACPPTWRVHVHAYSRERFAHISPRATAYVPLIIQCMIIDDVARQVIADEHDSSFGGAVPSGRPGYHFNASTTFFL